MTYDFEKFFDCSIDLLCIAGTDGRFKRINPAFERVLGWSVQELLNRPFIEFVHPEDAEATRTVLRHLIAGEPILEFENRYQCKDGGFRHLRWNAFPDPDSDLVFAVARDADRTRLSQLVVSERSGVKDRPTFDDRLEMLMKLGQRMGGSLSLLLIEVDHFDDLNESFGHSAGFEVLNDLAEMLVDNARKSDVVARYLGEKFAIILPDTPATGATQFAERLRAVIHEHDWDHAGVTISVGASTLRFRKGNSARQEEQKRKLIDDAERALARARKAGCNRTVHAADMSEVVS
jgi:diguanylate cyclase (GGDEF)-like protein/PAS domain S-box-containing protein